MPRRPDRVIADVARRVAELRKAHGWTQESFAEELGKTVRYVQRLEQGMNLSIRTATVVAAALRADVRELYAEPKGSGARRTGRPAARKAPPER